MKNVFVLLFVAFLSSGAFAHDPYVRRGGGYGGGGSGFQDQQNQRSNYGGHHHDRGPNVGALVVGAMVLGATAVIIDRALPLPPPQMVYCDQTPFVRGGLVYANPCDGSGMGPVVVGRIDRR